MPRPLRGVSDAVHTQWGGCPPLWCQGLADLARLQGYREGICRGGGGVEHLSGRRMQAGQFAPRSVGRTAERIGKITATQQIGRTNWQKKIRNPTNRQNKLARSAGDWGGGGGWRGRTFVRSSDASGAVCATLRRQNGRTNRQNHSNPTNRQNKLAKKNSETQQIGRTNWRGRPGFGGGGCWG